jgi:hypothetical protein
VSHPDDTWQGVLNLPTNFRVRAVAEATADGAAAVKCGPTAGAAAVGPDFSRAK